MKGQIIKTYFIVSVLFFLESVQLFAQDARLSLMLDDAKTSFKIGNFEESLSQIKAVEKEVGVTSKTLYLRIINWDKLYFEESRDTVFRDLDWDVSKYLGVMEGHGVDDEYRNVYEISKKVENQKDIRALVKAHNKAVYGDYDFNTIQTLKLQTVLTKTSIGGETVDEINTFLTQDKSYNERITSYSNDEPDSKISWIKRKNSDKVYMEYQGLGVLLDERSEHVDKGFIKPFDFLKGELVLSVIDRLPKKSTLTSETYEGKSVNAIQAEDIVKFYFDNQTYLPVTMIYDDGQSITHFEHTDQFIPGTNLFKLVKIGAVDKDSDKITYNTIREVAAFELNPEIPSGVFKEDEIGFAERWLLRQEEILQDMINAEDSEDTKMAFEYFLEATRLYDLGNMVDIGNNFSRYVSKKHGKKSEAYLVMQLNVGLAYFIAKEYKMAETILEDNFKQVKKVWAEDDPLFIHYRNLLAASYDKLGSPQKVNKLY